MAVQTVTGKITREQLGVVAPHEHVFIDLTGFYEYHPVKGCADPANDPVQMHHLGVLSRDPYAIRDNLILSDPELQYREVREFALAGGNTIVDASSPGIGRDVRALRKIAERTGLNVIAGTGYYVGATHPASFSSMSDEEVADTMIRELREGMEGTDIRAGYIGEIGISENFTEAEKKALRASAIAQRATGVGVEVHINPWMDIGVEAAQILLDGGVPEEKICICHIDVQNHKDYIKKLLDLGVYVEFDNFGKEYYVDIDARRPGYDIFVKDTDRVSLLAELLQEGYEEQILLTCDLCLKSLLHAYGGWGYDHVLTNIVPMMREYGITDRQIDGMLRDNPANFFDVPDSFASL